MAVDVQSAGQVKMILNQFKVNSSDVVSETIDGETVVVSLTKGTYYSLDQVGAAVWSLIEAEVTVETIVSEVLSKFDGDTSEMTRETENLIAQLQAEQLIVPSDASGNTAALRPSDSSEPKQPFVPPVLQKYSDMQDLLMLDPIHEVDQEEGWPAKKEAAA